jgi:hypothetical protein
MLFLKTSVFPILPAFVMITAKITNQSKFFHKINNATLKASRAHSRGLILQIYKIISFKGVRKFLVRGTQAEEKGEEALCLPINIIKKIMGPTSTSAGCVMATLILPHHTSDVAVWPR